MTEDINDPLVALRSELASVAPSPEFVARVRQRLIDEAGELTMLREELTAVAPSPDFAARVRQRIEGDGRRHPWLWLTSNWRWMAPASGLAVAALVALAIFSQVPRVMQVPPMTHVAQVPQVTQVPQGPQAAPPRVAPAPTVVGRPGRQRAASETRATDPMLEVITNQPELLRRMWADVRPLQPGVLVEPAAVAEAGEIVVAPIAVEPVLVKWMVEPLQPAGSGAAPVIKRIAALAAERSFQ